MLPFLLLFLYLGVLSKLTANILDENKKRIVQSILGGIGLWMLLGLRSWTCGQDLLYIDKGTGYILSFLLIGDNSLYNTIMYADYYEPGFMLLNWLTYNYLSTDPQIFLVVTGGVEMTLIGYTIYKNSPNIILSYLAFACLGLYIFSFSGLRQGLGIACTFFAFNYVKDKIPLRFFLIVAVAYTFHRSSVLFLPAIFFVNRTLSLNKAIGGIIAVLLFLPLLMPTIQFFSVLLYDKEKYGEYQGGAYGLFLLFVLILLYSYFYNRGKDEKIDMIRWMALIAVFLQSSGILSAGALARISYCYSIFFCLLIPWTVNSAPVERRRIIGFAVSMLLILFFVYCNRGGYLNVVPYRFFWEEVNNV